MDVSGRAGREDKGIMMKHIIFDIGNVLIGYRWQDMLIEDYGMNPEDALRLGSTVFNNPNWLRLDAGDISLQEMAEYAIQEMPDLAEDVKWFFGNARMMRVKRPSIWNEMKVLREKGYDIYLLSNYSEELLESHIGDTEIRDLVDGGVVSFQIHEIKPEPAIYQYLLQKYNLKPEDCLFFDDREDNVEAARKLGISAIVVTGEEQLLEELKKL